MTSPASEAPTPRGLLAVPALALTLRVGGAGLDRPISWVHASDLSDPTPYLDGGELVLMTGLALPSEPANVEDYVARLRTAGAAGIGFAIAIGVGHDAVPDRLVAACEAQDMPLLEVPRRTPFIAIAKEVSRILSAREYAAATRGDRAKQELTRAALRRDRIAGVVRRLGQELSARVLLTDPDGLPLVSSAGTEDWPERYAAELRRLRSARTPGSVAVDGPGGGVVAVRSLGAHQPLGLLWTGRDAPFDRVDHDITQVAASLLTLMLDHQPGASRPREAAPAGVRAALLELLHAGEWAAFRTVAAGCGWPRDRGRLRVAVLPDTDDATEPAEWSDALALPEEGRLVVLLPSDAEPPAGSTPVGVSEAVALERFDSAYRQAERAADEAKARGGGVLRYADLSDTLLDVVATDAARARAEALLEPLFRHDRSGRGELVRSLTAWLEAGGHWEGAAAELGCHRHTLRRRLARVSELVGRDLNTQAARTELWLALSLRD